MRLSAVKVVSAAVIQRSLADGSPKVCVTHVGRFVLVFGQEALSYSSYGSLHGMLLSPMARAVGS